MRLTDPLSLKNLGILRDNHTAHFTGEAVQEKINTSRKTLYAMVGGDFHRRNSLNPKVILHLIKVYVTPRLVYDLKAVSLISKDTLILTACYQHLLKQLLHLPSRMSDSISYLLFEEITIKAEIQKHTITTFGTICNDNSILNQLA